MCQTRLCAKSYVFNISLYNFPSVFDDKGYHVFLDNMKSCLMYADGLVLLSQSALGLQNSLHKLNEYCFKWKLTVNVGKTKNYDF